MAPDDPNTFLALVNNLPNDCVFSAFDRPHADPFVAMAALRRQRTCRPRGQPVPRPGHKATNAELVARAKQLLESMNVRILGPRKCDKLKLIKH
jgi:uncharacterized protein (DUF849 family)